ncbi:hypothetical protein ACLB1T_10270 [Escherichia coli]
MRYQAAPITECGAHLTAQIRPRRSLNSKMYLDRQLSATGAPLPLLLRDVTPVVVFVNSTIR